MSDSVSDPVRTCVGCRRRAAKRELVRVTAGSDTDGRPAVVPDPDGTAPGRGAHLHPTTACYDLAVRRRAWARALRLSKDLTGLSTAPVVEHLARLTPPAAPVPPAAPGSSPTTSHRDRSDQGSSSS